MIRTAVLCLSLALVLPASSLAETPQVAYAPSTVLVLPSPNGDMIVGWAPGAEPAEQYRVYGVTATSSLVHLHTEAEALVVEVESGFVTYAVSGVSGGVESRPTFAVVGGCVQMTMGPPPDVSTQNCRVQVPIG